MFEPVGQSFKQNFIAENAFDIDGLSVEESNQLLSVYKQILEVTVTGDDFQHALDCLCRAAEGILPNAVASVMIFNEDKTALKVRSAPNLSSCAVSQLNGLEPGENSGSCGTAVFKQTPQYVYDTKTDPRWKNLQEFVEEFNVNACWSMPIIQRDNNVTGSFALSSFKRRTPTAFQQNLLQTAAYLASLVLMREQEDAKLQLAAHCDQLTQLPNRNLFNMRAEHAIARAQRNRQEFGIFFIDLDNFKLINDEYGHMVGDKVLHCVAKRMNESVRTEDTLARLGGDEFVLLIESFRDRQELHLIAQKLLSTFQIPVSVGSSEHKIDASIGISMFPIDGDTVFDLIKKADQAMYSAKKSEQDRIKFIS